MEAIIALVVGGVLAVVALLWKKTKSDIYHKAEVQLKKKYIEEKQQEIKTVSEQKREEGNKQIEKEKETLDQFKHIPATTDDATALLKEVGIEWEREFSQSSH